MKLFTIIAVAVALLATGYAGLQWVKAATHHPHFENQGHYGPWTGATE